jgi:hypothetical protein
MTNGQLKQFQDLSKCYMRQPERGWVWRKFYVRDGIELAKWEKATLRRLTHQYRNQIRAVKRNQERT